MKQPILIADDDAGAREALRLRLTHAGFEAVTVGSGAQAIAAFDKFKPRIILLDASMPDISGFDVCRHIKEQAANAATVIFVSGATGPGVDYLKQCGKLCGGDRFITKPYNAALLVEVVRGIEHESILPAEPSSIDHSNVPVPAPD
jgi:two-component system, HptB-dependent secretion and biofilm response regulator